MRIARTTASRRRRARHGLVTLLLAVCLVACADSQPEAAVTAPAASTPAPRQIASTPCELITRDELRKVFPLAEGARQEQHDAFGIASCEWNGEFGRLLVQQWPSKGHTPRQEVRDLARGFTDGSEPDLDRVRLVPVEGMGHYATAVVERRDPDRGVLADMAVLSISRDGKTLVFLTDGLDEFERDEALKRLSLLGGYAYQRL